MEAQRHHSMQRYIELLEKHSQWVEFKAPAMAFSEAESQWKHTGSTLRESIRKIVRAIRTSVVDYLNDYGRDLRVDVWGSGGGDSGSNEPDDIEINGP